MHMSLRWNPSSEYGSNERCLKSSVTWLTSKYELARVAFDPPHHRKGSTVVFFFHIWEAAGAGYAVAVVSLCMFCRVVDVSLLCVCSLVLVLCGVHERQLYGHGAVRECHLLECQQQNVKMVFSPSKCPFSESRPSNYGSRVAGHATAADHLLMSV